MNMKIALYLMVLAAAAASSIFFAGCMTQEARTERVGRRQDRIDTRTAGRQERWEIRGEREDARAARRFDSW
jgi:outer membrane murein-binding lipoprotein Lpp